MRDLDLALLDMEFPVRAPTDDPMWIPDAVDHAVMGSFLSKLASVATAPIRVVASTAHRAAMAPLYALQRGVNAITPGPPGGGGGGGGGGDAPSPAPAPDDQPPMDPGDGGGDPSMSAGNWMHPSQHPTMFRGMPGGSRHHHRHPSAAMGFGLPDWHPLKFLEEHNPFRHTTPAGELLVSAVPGGVAAKEAHAIATKALKNGTLKPAHLKKAGSLARAARSGHKGSLKKIAQIKRQAGTGDPNAEVALDRLRLADSIQQGGMVQQSTTSLRHLRNIGLATLKA